MTVLRTVGALLFFLFFMVLVITPLTWLYVHCGRMTERKKWNIHLLIYRAARVVVLHIGIPGTTFRDKLSPDYDPQCPSVYICNHQSHLGLICLLALTPRMIFLTNNWVWHNPLYGFLIHHAEYYPASEGLEALMPRFRSLVERGYSIAIFPEGTRSNDLRQRVGNRHRSYVSLWHRPLPAQEDLSSMSHATLFGGWWTVESGTFAATGWC